MYINSLLFPFLFNNHWSLGELSYSTLIAFHLSLSFDSCDTFRSPLFLSHLPSTTFTSSRSYITFNLAKVLPFPRPRFCICVTNVSPTGFSTSCFDGPNVIGITNEKRFDTFFYIFLFFPTI